MRTPLLALALLGFAGSASAEDIALMRLTFGEDAVQANAGQVEAAAVTDGMTGSILLHVLMAEELNPAVADLTTRHVGDIGRLLICGQQVAEMELMTPLAIGQFVVNVGDKAETERLAAILTGGACPSAG